MKYQHIILIDDDDDDHEIFTAAVAQVCPSTTCAVENNASEALKKLLLGLQLPDAIFLDLNMPVMNGIQFLEEIKKVEGLNKIPIIIFSTTSHAPIIKQAKLLGAYDFLTKPATYNELVDLLKPMIQ